MILMEIVKRKLAEKEQRQKIATLLPILQRLGDEKYRPQRGSDAIVNPYSEFKTVAEKRAAYNKALDEHAVVWTGFKEFVPIGSPGATFNDIEYVAGLWRKQCKFSHDTVHIHDKEFVLLNKLDRKEHTGFDFYNADTVLWGGAGQSCGFKPSYIVASRDTTRGKYYAYGCTLIGGIDKAISCARAHLTCTLFDAFQDRFESVAQITNNSQAHINDADHKPGIWYDKDNVSYDTVRIPYKDKKQATVQYKDFVLLGKLNRKEHNGFEYYTADTLTWLKDNSNATATPSYIIAKRKTNRGTFYAYGCLLTDGFTEAVSCARSHLTCNLFDIFQDVFESAMQK